MELIMTASNSWRPQSATSEEAVRRKKEVISELREHRSLLQGTVKTISGCKKGKRCGEDLCPVCERRKYLSRKRTVRPKSEPSTDPARRIVSQIADRAEFTSLYAVWNREFKGAWDAKSKATREKFYKDVMSD
jgi:hypothetical protein